MFQRLTALVLALIVGSPTCWCCAQGSTHEQAAPKAHSCCERAASSKEDAQHSDKKDSKDPCPCALSRTKRDQQPTDVALPNLVWSTAAPFEVQQDLLQALPTSAASLSPYGPHNTGPPDTRPPPYKRYHAYLN